MAEQFRQVTVAYLDYSCHYIARIIIHLISNLGYEVQPLTEHTFNAHPEQAGLEALVLAASPRVVVLLGAGSEGMGTHRRNWLTRLMREALHLERAVTVVRLDNFAFDDPRNPFEDDLAAYRHLPNSTLDSTDWQAGTPALQRMLAHVLDVYPPVTTRPLHEEVAAYLEQQLAGLLAMELPGRVECEAERHLRCGLAYLHTDNQQAIRHFDDALEVRRNYGQALDSRAYARFWERDHANALQDIEHAAAVLWDEANVLNHYGMVLAMLGANNEALLRFDHALTLNPADAAIHNNRGFTRCLSGDYQGAIEDTHQALDLDPNLNAAYCTRGVARLLTHDYGDALCDFSTLLARNPDHREARTGKALAYFCMGDTADALADYRALIHRNPNFNNPNWVAHEFTWVAPLVEELRGLLAELQASTGSD
jgi:Tfp pilus assembly protein PilF